MKRILGLLIVAFVLVMMPTVKADTEKVRIYLFWTSWCPHCHDFIDYFSDKYMNYTDSFEIVTYQVDDNEINYNLMTEIASVLGYESSGIPFIVIGDWYQVGFGTNGSNIIEKALEYKNSGNYKDVVATTIKDKGLESDPKSFSSIVGDINDDYSESDDTNIKEPEVIASKRKTIIERIVEFIVLLLLNIFGF